MNSYIEYSLVQVGQNDYKPKSSEKKHFVERRASNQSKLEVAQRTGALNIGRFITYIASKPKAYDGII